MMASRDETDRQIAADVLPAQIHDLAVPAELNTLPPWHKPRKQLVRERQWLHFSRCLIKREKERSGLLDSQGGNPEVRYLTLPGIDYLDVRQLADVCYEFDCRLTSTGFQSGGERNRCVARAQFREKALIDAGYITRYSCTFARRFEDITETTSQAYRDLKRRGPFHIVNIDACGSIAAPTASHARRLIDAVYRTVELQLEIMTGQWLFFITVDARPDALAKETLDRLCKAIFMNADTNEDFRIQAAPLVFPGEVDIGNAVTKASRSTGEVFLRLFSLGFAKWLLYLARNKNWDMCTHAPYCYSTKPWNDETPSMVCLAFEFVPPPPGLQDCFEVARLQPIPTTERENTSIRAVDKIRDMINADSEIKSNKMLRTYMTDTLRKLLEEVGYDSAVLSQLDL